MSKVVSYVKRERARHLLKDLWTFGTETKILYSVEEQPHREMVQEIFDMVPAFGATRQKRKLYLAPRHSFKSSIVICLIIYLILRFPNIAISLYRSSQQKATEMLEAIKDILTKNEVILEVFGDLSIDAPSWTDKKITLATRSQTRVDPTVAASGLRTAMAGAHPDLVCLDDIVNEVNCDSVIEMEKATNCVTSQYPILPPHGSLLITGTRWSDIDAYGRILDINRDLIERDKDPDYEEYIRKAWERDENGEIKLFFPSKLTLEFLERQKDTITNPKWYASWYFQETHEQGLHAFPRDRIRLFDARVESYPYHAIIFDQPTELVDWERPVLEVPVYLAAVLDPSLTGSKASSDSMGFTIQAWDKFKNWFFLEALEIRALPSVAGEIIIKALVKYRPKTFLIETQNADVEMVARFQRAIREHDLDCIIRSYSALQDEREGERSKDRRILAMEPIVKRRKFLARRGMCGPLLKQMDAYPNLVRNDVIDSAAMGKKLERFAPIYAQRLQMDDGREPEDLFEKKLDEMERYPGMAQKNTIRGAWTGPFR